MATRIHVALLAAILVAAQPAHAGPFEDAIAAMRRFEYDRAVQLLAPLAASGHAGAQRELGMSYLFGFGVARDAAKALALLESAADLGDPDAMNNLGTVYAEGWTGQKDGAKAILWYSKAADKKFIYAYESLGSLYAEGTLVPKDLVQAYRWLALGAKAGSTMAELRMKEVAKQMTPAQLEEARRE